MIKEALIYCLRGQIAASRGARKLAYPDDMSRFLRAGLLALHPARRINQRFLNPLTLLAYIAAASLFLLGAENASAGEPQYRGNKNCAGCHEGENQEWQQSVHAKAFELLAPGKRVGFKKKAGLADIDYRANVSCQKCHTTGYGQEGGFVDIESTPEMAGVGCESCHGPSSKYRETHKNKNFTRAKARAEGQTYASLGDRDACEKCHSVASPFNPGVNPKYIFDIKKRLSEGTASFHEIRPLD